MSDQFDCSFCKAPKEDADYIIAGPVVNICGDCVRLCAQIVAASDAKAAVRKALGAYHQKGYSPGDDPANGGTVILKVERTP